MMSQLSRRTLVVAVCTAFLAGCSSPSAPDAGPLLIAAAANLTSVFEEIAKAYTAKTGEPVRFNFGATAQLAEQIRNGAPFDVFAAADVEHVDQLVSAGALVPGSRAIYARGQLALWIPQTPPGGFHGLAGLGAPAFRYIAIAQPKSAPYGQAAVEALEKSGLWSKLQPKVVYATNISTAKQFAQSGNADAAFTAYSLVLQEKGTVYVVPADLHRSIDQALGVLTSSKRTAGARRFASFVCGAEGQSILQRFGYLHPGK